jgi:hypothetical protein
MTQKEQILTEWLLRNNFVWDNIDSASKGQHDRSYYNEDEISEINENNSEEIKSILAKRGNWYTVCPPLFVGDLVYFENESFISDEDFVESRKNLCEWILKNKIKITDKGISVVHNKNFCKTHKTADRADSEHMPRIDGWYSGKDVVEPRTKMKRISSFIKDSTIVIRNTSLWGDNRIDSIHDLLQGYLTSLDESSDVLKRLTIGNEDGSENDLGKLLYKNSLACKFNEVDDFIYVGEIWMEKQSIFTLDNFPNLVRGNLVIEKSYFLNDYSGFPKRVKGSVYFNDCRYKEFMEFPSGVSIDGNFNFYGQNTQHMLLALAKSDVKISGNVYCPLYSGTIEHLREIAEEGKWFENYEKVKQERSVRGDNKRAKHNRRDKGSSENS